MDNMPSINFGENIYIAQAQIRPITIKNGGLIPANCNSSVRSYFNFTFTSVS